MERARSTSLRGWVLGGLLFCAAFAIGFAPREARASDVQFVGSVSYAYLGNVATLTADEIANFDLLGYSGTLRMELWAFPTPYTPGQAGYKLAVYSPGFLFAGFHFSNVSSGSIFFGPPPNGVWYFSLLLTEYTGVAVDNGYTVRDYRNFSTPQTFGPPPPPPGQLTMPSPVTFVAQQVGTQSAPITVTVTNIGGSAVTISSVNATDLTEFPGTTTCLTTIPAGGNCQITFSFLPTAIGLRSETVTVTSTGVGSPQSFTVSGTSFATPPPGQLNMPLPVTFPAEQVGTQSAPISVTVTNIGGSAVTISSVNGTDLTEFPGTTTCLATIPAGGSCQVTLSFLPTAIGVRSETVMITSTGVGSPQSFVVSGTGSPVATSPNYEGLWWASPAGAESGWGINFAHQGDIIFASWFTYDVTGKGLWLVMTAPKTGPNTYAGALYTTTGPAFNAVPFNPAQVVPTQVGTGTLTFTDSNSGSFAYTVNGISQTKAITHEVFGTLPTCNTAVGSLAAATNYQDLWWAAPAGVESGWGINLTHQGDTIFATWFTYDFDHSPMWLVVTAAKTGSGVYTGTLYRTTGPAFNSVPFNPANVVATAVGTATFSFVDGNDATFAYTVYGISQTKAITREVFDSPGTVCQ